MDTTLDTVFLTHKDRESLLEVLNKPSTVTKTGSQTEMFRPVGRVAYEKRKYCEIPRVSASGVLEVL